MFFASYEMVLCLGMLLRSGSGWMDVVVAEGGGALWRTVICGRISLIFVPFLVADRGSIDERCPLIDRQGWRILNVRVTTDSKWLPTVPPLQINDFHGATNNT